MSNLRFNKVKSQTPITVIIHGGNRLGYLLSKVLIEQNGYVVIVDKFTNETKKYVSELKKSDLVDFFDFKGYESLFKNIKRFDYVYYLLDDKLSQKDFESKEFLLETKYLELSLTHTKKNDAKFSLVTSLSLNRELANRVNNEKLATPSPYSNIELQKYCETMVAEYKDKTNINARIIRIGTLLGKGITKVQDDALDTLFKESTQSTQITIKGEGLNIHNLIHEDDATYGVLKLTFADSTKGEVITLANKNDYTTLSIAYKLLELNTEAQSIRFVENPDEKFIIQDLYVPAPHASKYGWNQQVTLEKAMIEQIQNYYDEINKSWDIAKTAPAEKKAPLTKESKTKLGEFISNLFAPLRRIKLHKGSSAPSRKAIFQGFFVFILIALFSYFLLYPILGSVIGLSVINSTTKELSQSFLDVDRNKNSQNIAKINRNITRVSDSFDNLEWVFKILGKQDLYDDTTKVLLAAQNTADGGTQLAEAVYPLAIYIKDFEPAVNFQDTLPSTTREYREYLEMIDENKYKLDEASYKIALASEILKGVDVNTFPQFMRGKILEIKEMIKKAGDATTTYKESASFLPDILGVNERRRYLLLLQNESELRSTGGWITSYGIVGLEGGQIRELFVDDIYNADGTLRVMGKRYSAPSSMAEALGIRDTTFSLVNWTPDLSETRLAAETYVKDLGKGGSVDGVITMDIAFLQKLLDKWGGIEVPGEDQLITSDNIHAKVFEMHREFTPGSTQKTTFLANLANEIVKKLLSMDIQQIMGISDVLQSSLDEKHLQVAFKNSQAFNFFNSRDWAGSIDAKYNDAPVVIDWNWGGNKANQYLNKNHSLSVNIKDEDTIDFAYSVTVENTSTTDVYPEGKYVNYQRVYIPAEAQVLKIDGIQDNKYTIYKESGFKVIGGWFNVPVKGISTMEISYRLERSKLGSMFPITSQDSTSFLDLNIFKQAGEKRHSYKLDIIYPSTWVLSNSAGLNTISNQLSGRFELNKDTEYRIVWENPR